MRTRLFTALAATGLLLAACSPTIMDADEPTDAPEDEADSESEDDGEPDDEAANDAESENDEAADAPALALTASCTNEEDGYRLHFPEDWHANPGEVTAACQVLDVEPPQVEPDTALPLDAALLVTVEERSLDEVRDWVDGDPATDVDGVTEDEIGGWDVLRVEGTATGDAFLEAGVEVHRTYLAFDGRTLRVEANELGEPDLDLRRDLVADLLATLEPIDA